jgi:lauroyl/myristoyl acyltransferase
MNLLLDLLGRIPRPILAAFGSLLGWLIWTLRIRRGVVMDNLRLAFPEKSEAERRAIARANYAHLGQMIPDFLRVPTMEPEELDRIFVQEGWEILEAAVVFAISVPLGDGRHKVVIEGPLVPAESGDREADDLAFMQLLNDKLEAWVRRHPERWYWLHRRWKTRPPVAAAPVPAAPAPGPAGSN